MNHQLSWTAPRLGKCYLIAPAVVVSFFLSEHHRSARLNWPLSALDAEVINGFVSWINLGTWDEGSRL